MASKKMPLAKKLVLIGVPLAFAQAAYIFIFQDKTPPLTIKQAINEQVAKNRDIPADRRDLAKVQVALAGFRMQKGSYPKALSELVPEFLDTVPLDPTTGAAFKYSVADDRYSLGDTILNQPGKKPGSPPVTTGTDKESQLLAYLDTGDTSDNFIYDPSNKRDPFRSFDFSPQKTGESSDTPLEQYTYNDLKLSAVIEGMGEPRAVIEDPNGKGHTVSVGTKIGNLGGVVMKIDSDKIVILEKSIEFTGETQTRTVEMYIR